MQCHSMIPIPMQRMSLHWHYANLLPCGVARRSTAAAFPFLMLFRGDACVEMIQVHRTHLISLVGFFCRGVNEFVGMAQTTFMSWLPCTHAITLLSYGKLRYKTCVGLVSKAGSSATGLNISKQGTDPLLKQDEELPPWLWKLAQQPQTLNELRRISENDLTLEEVRGHSW
jgi:hypothetical protein